MRLQLTYEYDAGQELPCVARTQLSSGWELQVAASDFDKARSLLVKRIREYDAAVKRKPPVVPESEMLEV